MPTREVQTWATRLRNDTLALNVEWSKIANVHSIGDMRGSSDRNRSIGMNLFNSERAFRRIAKLAGVVNHFQNEVADLVVLVAPSSILLT